MDDLELSDVSTQNYNQRQEFADQSEFEQAVSRVDPWQERKAKARPPSTPPISWISTYVAAFVLIAAILYAVWRSV